MRDHDAAVELASAHTAHAAKEALGDLLRLLGIGRDDPALAEKLAPFAPVWAAMIAAAARGHGNIVLARPSAGARA